MSAPRATRRAFAIAIVAIAGQLLACSAVLGMPPPTHDDNRERAVGGAIDAGEADDGVAAAPAATATAKPLDKTTEDWEYIYPFSLYTGFDGINTYRAPVSIRVGEGARRQWEWTSEDSSVASVVAVPSPESFIRSEFPSDAQAVFAMITAIKPGTTEIVATSGTKHFKASVVVTSYTVEQVNIGRKRYWTSGSGLSATACASCHEGLNGVDNTSSVIAASRDANLLPAVLEGVYADGAKLILSSHKWQLTDEEKMGILPFLRSQPPKGF
jgi:hypothetical protein